MIPNSVIASPSLLNVLKASLQALEDKRISKSEHEELYSLVLSMDTVDRFGSARLMELIRKVAK